MNEVIQRFINKGTDYKLLSEEYVVKVYSRLRSRAC